MEVECLTILSVVPQLYLDPGQGMMAALLGPADLFQGEGSLASVLVEAQ